MTGADKAQASGARRRLASVVVTIALALVVMGQIIPVQASSRGKREGNCPSTRVVAAAQLPPVVESRDCALVGKLVAHGSLTVRVPPPGHGTGASALGVDGESSLYISNSEGTISISESSHDATEALFGDGPAPAPCDEMGLRNCLPPCKDDTFNLFQDKPKVKNSQPWYFKRSSTPSGLGADKALTHIKAGTQAILNGRNDCGLGDPVSKIAPYKGTTQRSALPQGEFCFGGDGKNVVDFGQLWTLGMACYQTYTTGGPWYIVEADIRLQKSADWTTTPDAADCEWSYDVQGVIVHERGHAFGLDHAAQRGNAHLPQTMYWSSFPCNSYQRTLGKGDIAGLKALY